MLNPFHLLIQIIVNIKCTPLLGIPEGINSTPPIRGLCLHILILIGLLILKRCYRLIAPGLLLIILLSDFVHDSFILLGYLASGDLVPYLQAAGHLGLHVGIPLRTLSNYLLLTGSDLDIFHWPMDQDRLLVILIVLICYVWVVINVIHVLLILLLG